MSFNQTPGMFTGYLGRECPNCDKRHRPDSKAAAICRAKLEPVNSKTTGGGRLETENPGVAATDQQDCPKCLFEHRKPGEKCARCGWVPHFYVFGRCLVNGHSDCPPEPSASEAKTDARGPCERHRACQGKPCLLTHDNGPFAPEVEPGASS